MWTIGPPPLGPGTFDQPVHVVEIGADRNGMEQGFVVPARLVHVGGVGGDHPAGRLGKFADIAQNRLEARIDRRIVDVVQRGRKHGVIDTKRARDKSMRAIRT
jgi:hypothetical protein